MINNKILRDSNYDWINQKNLILEQKSLLNS